MTATERKIVIISPVPTHPTNAGNRNCILLYSEILRELGYVVYFCWIPSHYRYYQNEYDETQDYWKDRFLFCHKSQLTALLTKFIDAVCFKFWGYCFLDSKYPFPFGINIFLRNIQKIYRFDTVIINYVFLSRFFKCFHGTKKILYTHDVFTNKGRNLKNKWVSLTPNDEAKGLDRADIILSIQENETIFCNYLTGKQIFTVYSCFHVKQTPLIGVTGDDYKILYLASGNVYNIEAIHYFYNEVFSQLKNLYPNIRLIIGGAICDKIKSTMGNDKNIELQGVVSDLYQFYSQADICVNPTFIGTGLKIKTFEALSYGKIVVAHPHSLMGVYDRENVPVLLASNKVEYIEQIKKQFSSKNNWDTLKENAIAYMSRFQSYVKNQFEQALNNE
jgi:glycosyltransferase involved in cell wall biosynthesis